MVKANMAALAAYGGRSMTEPTLLGRLGELDPQAACLSEYLTSEPDLGAQAFGFFEWQRVAVDAAWSVSSARDTARPDTMEGVEVPEEVQRARWEMDQVLRATLHDDAIAKAFNEVTWMFRHPLSLRDPALIERAVAANQRAATAS